MAIRPLFAVEDLHKTNFSAERIDSGRLPPLRLPETPCLKLFIVKRYPSARYLGILPTRREQVYRFSGYPGGLKQESYAELLARKPEDAIRRSVRGMLPKGPLGRQMLRKLKVYAGAEHPHASQHPAQLELPQAKAR